MTAQPADRIPASGPDTGPYEVIHLGGQAAVVVPVSDFLRLQALEQAASTQELEDAEDQAALADWRAREAAGQTSYVPHDEALRRARLSRVSRQVIWEAQAIDQAAGFLRDDPGGIREMLDAVGAARR